MTYLFSKKTPSTGAITFYELKTLLKLAGWTTLSSSDGTTYNSSGDQITSGASGANGWNNTRAWARVQAPDGYQEYTFQRTTSSIAWRIKYSRAGHFTGGAPAATVTPSAADEVVLMGSGSDAAPTGISFLANDATYRWNAAASNTYPYTFWASGYPLGGGSQSVFIGLEFLTATEPSDAHVYLAIAGTASAGVILNSANLSLQTRTTGSATRTVTYLASAAPTTVIEPGALLFRIDNGTVAFYPDGATCNPITNKFDVAPIIWARSSAVANPGYKGIGTMIKWTSSNKVTGDTLSVNSTHDRIVYGSCSLPWDGTNPII